MVWNLFKILFLYDTIFENFKNQEKFFLLCIVKELDNNLSIKNSTKILIFLVSYG